MAHIWRGVIEEYRDRLPIAPNDIVISLGEGGTPLVYACTLSELTGAKVYLKVEGMNPTGSLALSKAHWVSFKPFPVTVQTIVDPASTNPR